MNDVRVAGTGAVSPAGWGTPALLAALTAGTPLPTESIALPSGRRPLPVRRVPQPCPHRELLAHPRLRRAEALSLFAVAAAVEAVGGDRVAIHDGRLRLGVVFCTLAGGLGYTRRFYREVLAAPSTASPMLFPETGFNAPASHLGAVLGSRDLNYTLAGDSRMFGQGINVAAAWLRAGEADACVVVAAEELDWLVADGHDLFSHRVVAAEGAGAVYLKPAVAGTDDPVLRLGRRGMDSRGERPLLCDARTGVARLDAAEALAGQRWSGPRWLPQVVLGHGLTAAAGWQTVLAAEAIRQGLHDSAWVSLSAAGGDDQGLMLARGESQDLQR